MPWMILLVVALPYTILSFVMVRTCKSPHFSTNVIRSLAYVAIPTVKDNRGPRTAVILEVRPDAIKSVTREGH